MRLSPGIVRDSVVGYLSAAESASLKEIQQAVSSRIGDVATSSIRSYLNLNTPGLFERTARGSYRLRSPQETETGVPLHPGRRILNSTLFNADCFRWLRNREPRSLHAVITDPPYGLVEYTEAEQARLRDGSGGGIWRVPPSFDGHTRAPLPRFTVLNEGDHAALHDFFLEFGRLVLRATVPGANVIVASNPLVAHLVAGALSEAGLELRGNIVRLVMTMRGGDRPKNAHKEFPDVSVMPRSMFEPWIVLRHPLEGRVQDNLRKWKTGGFRRISTERPFGDVIKSSPTPAREKRIAPHPSLKPQAFLRRLAYSALPLGTGTILDPFAGSGSTLAAANAVGYESIGVERDQKFFEMAADVIPQLAGLAIKQIDPVCP